MTKNDVNDASAMDDKNTDADKDSVDRLPLESIPLASGALRGARLVKNARMETSVEIHNDPLSGSLQVSPESIADFMETSPRDQAIINSLAGLQSFDVYSLRGNLKKLGVEVKDADALDLSEDMKEGLSIYSLEFTRPLVEKIFGQGSKNIKTTQGLQAILRDPDMARVKENLKVIAEKTGLQLSDIPKFIEEYSEVFLSVSYYRYSFESVGPDIDRFLFWMCEVRSRREVISSPKTLDQCKEVEEILRFLGNSIRERLLQFQTSFELFWADINKESFGEMRKQIEENHSSMGSVLCGLVVKMNLWKKTFPDNTVGGPATRAKFVVTDMEPGLVRLKELENDARRRLGMPAVRI